MLSENEVSLWWETDSSKDLAQAVRECYDMPVTSEKINKRREYIEKNWGLQDGNEDEKTMNAVRNHLIRNNLL